MNQSRLPGIDARSTFLVKKSPRYLPAVGQTQINVVINWFSELQQRVPLK
jgi:hypothetical protein